MKYNHEDKINNITSFHPSKEELLWVEKSYAPPSRITLCLFVGINPMLYSYIAEFKVSA